MVRITIKGGIWKNTEDEIMKAAVMKYGKNQWSRISSLLVRKSAKQCKARWYEWLDPAIKKTEWTRDEEEKLLHLAKIMPCQWRTIAPMIGRTASQCLEHYEKLLDAAQDKEETLDPRDDPRRLRPGEIDPLPEAKPARPDPVDMDEDEKEMLSEARARMANTKGKKAKRKAREKQLEEARRLASLQKRRELRAAGIEVKNKGKKRRNRIDYNEEIPFHKRPAPGFFDTSDEMRRTVEANNALEFMNVDIRQMDEARRDEKEEEERKKDKRRLALHKKKDLPAALIKINELNDPEQIRRRVALALPSPQVSDRELEDIAKMGGASEVVAAAASSGAAPTRTLLSNYSAQAPLPTPMRTPRTPVGQNTVLLETQNLIALTNQQTPLKGGENTPLHPTDFSGVNPKRRKLMTPNYLGTPGTPAIEMLGSTPRRTPSRTPGGSTHLTASGTPVRDELHINPLDTSLTAEEAMAASASRSQFRKRQAKVQRSLQGLSSLPKPSNEYALVMPDIPSEKEAGQDNDALWEEDAEDAHNRATKELEAQAAAEIARRTQAVQRGLPRPMAFNPATDVSQSPLISREVQMLLKHDAARFPMNGEAPRVLKMDKFSDDQLRAARDMIQSEASDADSAVNSVRKEEMEFEASDASMQLWEEADDDVMFLPSRRGFGLLSTASESEKLQALKQQFQLTREHAMIEGKRATKLESKLQVLTAGYQTRARSLHAQINESHFQLEQTGNEKRCFEALQVQEDRALPLRIESLKQEVGVFSQRNHELQQRFASLQKEKQRVEGLLSSSSA